MARGTAPELKKISQRRASKTTMGAWFAKIRVFFEETAEELKKCTWPTRPQLLESTLLVIVALIILAIFVTSVDWLLLKAINFVTIF